MKSLKGLLCLALVTVLAACSENPSIDNANVESPEAQLFAGEEGTNVIAGTGQKAVGVAGTVYTYEVVLENLTPATGMGSSQPFSPPVIATHNPSVRMFEVGGVASPELEGIAEDAMNEPMLALLDGLNPVFQFQEGSGAIPPGESATFEVQTRAGRRDLSMVFMLVNTNDAFGGVDRLRLPTSGTLTHMIHAYDAGTEVNSELESDIPGPCCMSPGNGTSESEPILRHPGILGGADLDVATYGWSGPVARLTITRILPTYELTLTNLTPDTGTNASQIFSPPVIATHASSAQMFRVGELASDELAQIAEDAINQPMIDLLDPLGNVLEVIEGGGAIPPGGSDTYTITSATGFDRLSMAFMLVNTNDAFSGTDSIRLPRGGGITYYLKSYDAGSEFNSELESDIPGPCCSGPGAGTDTAEPIAPHLGILGGFDLDPAIYDWDEPTAMLEIVRVK